MKSKRIISDREKAGRQFLRNHPEFFIAGVNPDTGKLDAHCNLADTRNLTLVQEVQGAPIVSYWSTCGSDEAVWMQLARLAVQVKTRLDAAPAEERAGKSATAIIGSGRT